MSGLHPFHPLELTCRDWVRGHTHRHCDPDEGTSQRECHLRVSPPSPTHSTVRNHRQWNPWESASSFTKCSNPPGVCLGSPRYRRQRLDQGCHKTRPCIKIAVFGVGVGLIPARYTAEITIPKQAPRRHGYHGMRVPDLPGQTLYALLPPRQPDEQVVRVRHITLKVFEPFFRAKKVGGRIWAEAFSELWNRLQLLFLTSHIHQSRFRFV
jgi:hypothetical protein